MPSSRPTRPRCGHSLSDWTAAHFAHGRLPVMRMVVFEVVAQVLQVGCGSGRPLNAHFLWAQHFRTALGPQHLLQAGVHLFLFDELTPVGLGNTLAHGGTKAGIFLK